MTEGRDHRPGRLAATRGKVPAAQGPRRGADEPGKEGDVNGLAREYWSEVYDLRTPVEDDREKRSRVRRKKLVRQVTRRPERKIA